ncbi:MAG: hypothetical protein Q8M56_13770, partial [Desulfobacterales bacterium]|nr:hypothetical protein [Desulfobacterales bacterium]
MKKVLLVIGVLLICVSMAYAGSDVKGAIINKSDVKNAANVAMGQGAKANMGTVALKDSTVKGAVINKSNVQNAANVAMGQGATAQMGSVDLKGS